MAFLTCIIITLLGYQQIKGLQLTNIVVPEIADVKDTVQLSCSYNMGNHKLNSVKWYKDTNEFFRYSPLNPIPNIMTFPVVGVSLIPDRNNTCNNVACSVNLWQLGPKTSGSYRCEVSGDSPEFKLIHETANMTIAALPKHDPIINGVGNIYGIGDDVIANCTSDMSSPPATLYWYINNERAPTEFLQQQQERIIEADGFPLRYRSLGIRFQIDRARYKNSKGILKLKCLAKLEQIHMEMRESTVTIQIKGINPLKKQELINGWRNSVNSMKFSATNSFLALSLLICIKYIMAYK